MVSEPWTLSRGSQTYPSQWHTHTHTFAQCTDVLGPNRFSNTSGWFLPSNHRDSCEKNIVFDGNIPLIAQFLDLYKNAPSKCQQGNRWFYDCQGFIQPSVRSSLDCWTAMNPYHVLHHSVWMADHISPTKFLKSLGAPHFEIFLITIHYQSWQGKIR